MKPIVTPQPADSGAVRGMISALRGRYSFLQALPIGQTALAGISTALCWEEAGKPCCTLPLSTDRNGSPR